MNLSELLKSSSKQSMKTAYLTVAGMQAVNAYNIKRGAYTRRHMSYKLMNTIYHQIRKKALASCGKEFIAKTDATFTKSSSEGKLSAAINAMEDKL